MHRAIAEWLTARPWRAAMASAFCGVMSQVLLPFTVLAGAIPVLLVLHFNTGLGLAMAALGAFSATWVAMSVSQAPSWVLAGIVGLFFGPVLLSVLLKRAGSLNLCFQVAVLVTMAALVMVHVVLPDPAGVWQELLRKMLDSMAAAGITIEGDTGATIDALARTMWGALGALMLALVLGSLFLGCWWQSLLVSPGRFGIEYRQLHLGRVLGLCVTALFVTAFLVESALLSSLAWVAFAALSFQGLAAAHRSKSRGQINRGWLAAIYVLLIVPLSMSVTLLALAIWGFADNWLRPRIVNAQP